jgi:hypothetical protein
VKHLRDFAYERKKKKDDLMDCQLQVKLDILQGRLPVHNDLAAELAALALQCKSPKSLFILNLK